MLIAIKIWAQSRRVDEQFKNLNADFINLRGCLIFYCYFFLFLLFDYKHKANGSGEHRCPLPHGGYRVPAIPAPIDLHNYLRKAAIITVFVFFALIKQADIAATSKRRGAP